MNLKPDFRLEIGLFFCEICEGIQLRYDNIQVLELGKNGLLKKGRVYANRSVGVSCGGEVQHEPS